MKGNVMKPRAFVLIAASAVLFLAAAPQPSAQQRTKTPDWTPWRFLLGEWVGEGGGEPGQGVGGSTFALDLQNTILVRRNLAEYPATANRPAMHHDDLMIIYQQSGSTRAVYFDNEGHVIQYAASVSPDGTTWTFLSEPQADAPRFRLVYTKETADSVRIDFDIAPPGKPEAFSSYIQSRTRRK
jgi:hypothetical protein